MSATGAAVEGAVGGSSGAQTPAVCELSKGCMPPGVQLAAGPPGWTNEIARVTAKARSLMAGLMFLSV